MEYKIEKMMDLHWNQVANIYLEGIKTGIATFQSEVPTYEDWNNGHISSCRLVACIGDKVLGWAALSPTSSRCVYKGVAEVSIYIGEKYKGQGIGKALLTELIKVSEKNGFWTLQSGIIRSNVSSIDLHKKCGFREVGIREKVAKMNNGNWLDLILMEKRSATHVASGKLDKKMPSKIPEISNEVQDLSISQMLQMSEKLWEIHKDTWSPMEPEHGKISILYMIEEIGEAIAIIKKKSEDEIMNDPSVRERFVEELGDVLMYYSDTLNRFKITPKEFSSTYVKKFESNMKRDYEAQYKEK